MTQELRSVLMSSLVLIALLLSACTGAETPTDVPPTSIPSTPTLVPAISTPLPPTSTPAPTARPTPLSAKAILQAAFDASQKANSYRFDMDMLMNLSGPNIAEGTKIPMRFLGDVQPPDHMQGTMTISTNGMEIETQVVVMGDMSYVKNPLTGRWQVDTKGTTMFDPEDLALDPSKIEDLELLGEETVAGVPAHRLTGRARLPFSFEEPLGHVTTDMSVGYWISRKDWRLVQSTVEGKVDFTGQVKATATISMTMRLFDYDIPLKILPPEITDARIISVPAVGPVAITTTLLPPLTADTPEGHVQRGLASLADGRFGLATAHFGQALALRPDWTDALLYRGASIAIDGRNVTTALADLDRAIQAEPNRADAYTLRAWAHLRALLAKAETSDTAIPQARADLTRALDLDPKLTAAAGQKAHADVMEAVNMVDVDEAKAAAQFQTAMSDLEAVLWQDPDAAAGNYLPMFTSLAGLKKSDRTWLSGQVDKANAQLAQDPAASAAYGVRGLAKLVLASQPPPDVPALREAGDDLLRSIALVHKHMPDLADPSRGPLQVAKIWDQQEAAYASGSLYAQVFFNQNPQLFPEFAQMLASYWELQDIFAEIVDDPIIFDVAFSPDGMQIATLSESGPSYLRIWDAASGKKLREVKLDVERLVIATTDGNLDYSPDGRQVVVAYTNPVVRVVGAKTGEVALEIKHKTSTRSAVFSPDGKRILTVDPDGGVPTLWDAVTGAKQFTITVDSPVSAAAFSPDGRQIVGSGKKVQVWDAETGAVVATLTGGGGSYVSAPAISPDGRSIAVPGSPARVYDLGTNKELFTLAASATAVAFSPDGTRIAAAGSGMAGVWDAATGKLVFLAGHPGGTDSVAFSPDGRLLVTGGFDGRFRVWDAKTGAELWNQMAATLPWEPQGSGAK